MAVDPEIQAMLDMMRSMGFPSPGQISAAEMRAVMAQIPARPGIAMARVEDHAADGPGGPVPLRFYLPAGAPRALLLHIHGGGWTIGSIDSSDASSRALADRLRCAVLSVDYRLAPEHPFPAAVEDCWAALLWAAAHGEALVGRALPLVVGGDSAGGNLSAVMCLLARDAGAPAIAAQLLINPATDADLDAPALRAFESPFLTRKEMIWFFNQYVQEGVDRRDPRLAPIHARAFTGLPPAYVLTCEYDLLRAEGEAYGMKLAEAGVPTMIKRYQGATHSFLHLGPDLRLSREAFADMNAFLDGFVGG